VTHTDPDIPLGHIIPSHQTFGWCLHCPDRSPAEELAAWQTRELRRLLEAPAVSGGVSPATDSAVEACTCGGRFPVHHFHSNTHEPAADQTALRDRIVEAIADALKPRYGGPQHNTPGGLPLTATAEEIRLHRAQPLADAVLSVLPAAATHTGRDAVLEEAAERLDARAAEFTAAARKDPLAFVKGGTDARYHTADAWNAAAAELRRLAAGPAAVGAGAATTPDTEAPHPPRSTWTFEGEYAADKWHGIGNAWSDNVFDDAHERALAEWKQRAASGKEHLRLRMLRADTAYTVVAEHTPATPPAGGAPQPKEA
jgi:hypothetical protein